jgi:hypothetical protein
VVEELETHDGGSLTDTVGEGVVVRRGRGVARRVVVSEEETTRTDPKDGGEDTGRGGATGVGGALSYGGDGQRAEVRVDRRDPELFVLHESQVGQRPCDIRRVAKAGGLAWGDEEVGEQSARGDPRDLIRGESGCGELIGRREQGESGPAEVLCECCGAFIGAE